MPTDAPIAPIDKLLVANRGEIALRVMRTARRLGIATVAVYSDADTDSPHLSAADEAVAIGPAAAADSYLNGERIIAAAVATGADAIHPGYGFLSENAAFAQSVGEAGLTFIGPSAQAIAIMGDKAAAKKRMIAAGVPCVPGYEGDDQSAQVLAAQAAATLFPVMVKAAAGGGGRGMRLVDSAKALPAALKLARSEAENAFGDGRLIIEKAIVDARHVEIQVFADNSGHCIHFGERDCSVQRRHQKVIEEAPCPIMDAELRQRMGAAAVQAAQAIGYSGAGTVEFLLAGDGHFYFLEMNTRLQVEHPVTEMVVGEDLVALQIAVAEGRPLSIEQSQVELKGHAIEVRLYAEDPLADFLPAAGRIDLLSLPTEDDLRLDMGIAEGQEITPFYDPMLGKIIAWGENRDRARRKLLAGLRRLAVLGPPTNRDFLIDCLERPAFVAGEATTAFIECEFGPSGPQLSPPQPRELAALAVLFYMAERDFWADKSLGLQHAGNRALLNFSNRALLTSQYRLAPGGEATDAATQAVDLSVSTAGGKEYSVSLGDETLSVSVRDRSAHSCTLHLDGWQVPALATLTGGQLRAVLGDRTFSCDNLLLRSSGDTEASGGRVTAPMHGKVLEVAVSAGDPVSVGDRLVVIEAMKMQHQVAAPVAGQVREVLVSAGDQVSSDDLMVEIESAMNGKQE